MTSPASRVLSRGLASVCRMGTIAVTCVGRGTARVQPATTCCLCKKGAEGMLGHVATETSHSSPEPPKCLHFQPSDGVLPAVPRWENTFKVCDFPVCP